MKTLNLLALCLVVGLCVGNASAKLVSYYNFTTDFDDQVGSNHGTVVGDVQLMVDPERGKVAGFGLGDPKSGLDCGGDPSTWMNDTDQMTVGGWIKDYDSGEYGGLWGVAQDDSWQVTRGAATGGTFWNTMGTSDPSHSTQSLSTSTAPWGDPNWHHIACTYNGTEKVIYLDGNPMSSQQGGAATGELEGPQQPINPGLSEDDHFWIGRHFGGVGGPTWGSFIGWMDDVAMYDVGLTEEQIETVASDLSAPYYLTSAKTGTKVETLFSQLGQLLLGPAPESRTAP